MRGLEMLTYNIGVCVRLQKSADTYIREFGIRIA